MKFELPGTCVFLVNEILCYSKLVDSLYHYFSFTSDNNNNSRILDELIKRFLSFESVLCVKFNEFPIEIDTISDKWDSCSF